MKTDAKPSKRLFPWWAYVILAFTVYYGLKYGPDWFLKGGDQVFAGLLGQFAPILAILFLLKGAIELYRGDDESDPEANPEK